jgi:hypothetical protein
VTIDLSVAGIFTVIFGPPSDLSGLTFSVAVGAGSPLIKVGLGAALHFTAGPKFRCLGFSVQISKGFGLPVSATLVASTGLHTHVLKF